MSKIDKVDGSGERPPTRRNAEEMAREFMGLDKAQDPQSAPTNPASQEGAQTLSKTDGTAGGNAANYGIGTTYGQVPVQTRAEDDKNQQVSGLVGSIDAETNAEKEANTTQKTNNDGDGS